MDKNFLAGIRAHARILLPLAAVLYYLLGRYAVIPTGIDLVYIYLQYPLLCAAAATFGPLAGFLLGLIGHLAVDFAGYGQVWPDWAAGSALAGALIGLLFPIVLKKTDALPGEHRFLHSDRFRFALTVLASFFCAFGLVTPVLVILTEGMVPAAAFRNGIFAAISNSLTSVIVSDICLTARHIAPLRRILAFLTLINSLFLFSHGNHSTGVLILYALTVFQCLYLFLHGTPLLTSAHKPVRIASLLVLVPLTLYFALLGFLCAAAHTDKPLGTEKYMIVLGAGLQGTEPNLILKSRLDCAFEYAQAHPEIKVITSGGQGADEVIAEGEVMRRYLVKLGLDDSRILPECASTTTEENFAFSKKTAEADGYAGGPVLYVTNTYHCYRAGLYAKLGGFEEAHALAAPTPVTGILSNYFREGLAMIKYWLVLLRRA